MWRESREERVLIIGATNRPFELDDAVIRRLTRRIYVRLCSSDQEIPLPDKQTRYELLTIYLKGQSVSLSREDVAAILERSENYSGSDLKVLCKEAAMGPVGQVKGLHRRFAR